MTFPTNNVDLHQIYESKSLLRGNTQQKNAEKQKQKLRTLYIKILRKNKISRLNIYNI